MWWLLDMKLNNHDLEVRPQVQKSPESYLAKSNGNVEIRTLFFKKGK